MATVQRPRLTSGTKRIPSSLRSGRNDASGFSTDGDDEQRDRRVADQHMLEHVGREQLLVAEPVERRDERQHEQREPGAEQQRAAPGRVVGPPLTQSNEGLGEQ